MSQIRLKTIDTPRTSRGGKLFRAFLLLIFLLLIAYFVASSSWFLQKVIVPRIGKALNSELIVGEMRLSPFSEVTLNRVKLTPHGADTLFEAKQIQVRYRLLSIIRGNIVVDEVVLDSPTINIVVNPEGGRNLDALVPKSTKAKPAKEAGSPPQVNLKSLTLRNATLRHTRNSRNGDTVTTELANVNLSIKDIKNGGNSTLTLSAALGMEKTAGKAVAAKLPCLLNSELSFGLQEDLQLASIKGAASFSVGRATGEFAELGGLLAKLDCEMSPTEVKQLALQFHKGTTPLGRVRVTGPFDTTKAEGKLKLEVLAIDRQVLNLFGAAKGIDFGTTTINDTTDITIAQAGRMISLAGRLDVARLQTVQRSVTSPTVDLTCTYDVTLDRLGNSLLLKAISLNGTQNKQPLVNATLSNPLTLAFGDTVNAADASLDFTLLNLNLADWRAFAPGMDLAGMASAKGKLFSKDGGKRLSLEIEKNIKGFSAKLGGGPTTIDDISVAGTINHSAEGDSINGKVALEGIKLTGVGGNPLQLTIGLDAVIAKQVAELRQCSLKLTPTARAKNEANLTGQVNLINPNAISGNLKLAAESLDVTDYYDLFTRKTSAATTTNTVPSKGPAPVPNQEPAPIKLPLSNFIVEATVGHLYLHEVDAANFRTTLLLDGSHVLLKPFQLTLNNAPVSAVADLDLSTPGYKYTIAFNADGVPVAPLANTFSPTYRGQAQGTLIAKLDLQGAGVTGRNLRTNLIGTADFNFTNANIQIVSPKLKSVLTPISLALIPLGVPDLLRSPLDHVNASLRAKDGKIEIPAFVTQSALFRADSSGSIPIADVLDNSPVNQPIEISLPRELAAKIGFANVPTNEPYFKLPTFVQLHGTLGKLDPKTDRSKLGALAAVGIGSAVQKYVPGETGQKIGGALNALGEAFGGKSVATNPPPQTVSTNAPGTNPPAKPNRLLDQLRKLNK